MPGWDAVKKDLEGANEERRRELMERFRSRCECPPCPTYAECAKRAGELAFCLAGRSSCIRTTKVCYCPGCPVHGELELEKMYYCVNGDEGEQRNE